MKTTQITIAQIVLIPNAVIARLLPPRHLRRSFFLMSHYVWRTCVYFNTTFQHENR